MTPLGFISQVAIRLNATSLHMHQMKYYSDSDRWTLGALPWIQFHVLCGVDLLVYLPIG